MGGDAGEHADVWFATGDMSLGPALRSSSGVSQDGGIGAAIAAIASVVLVMVRDRWLAIRQSWRHDIQSLRDRLSEVGVPS